MIKIYLLLVLASVNAWSQDRLKIVFSSSEVRQGALVNARLMVLPEQINLPLQKLKGTSFGETLYFHRLSPLLRKDGSETYESEVQVIFIKIPESTSIAGTVAAKSFVLEWDNLAIIPVEAPGKMLWAEFSAPDFVERNLVWIWTIVIVIPLMLAGLVLGRKYQKKKRIKERRIALLTEYKSCHSYEQVVSLWQKKRVFLSEFPQLEEPFRNLEIVLFKYQFKPSQTEHEKSEVMSAYRKLLQDSEGGLRGI